MQISTRFSIATHMLLCAAALTGSHKLTGELMASSVGVNPVIIRKISAQLKKYGLLNVSAGTGGAALTRPAEDITLYDVYKAVASVSENNLFNMHERPNPACFIGRNIEKILDAHMRDAQKALEDSLKKTSIADLASAIKNKAS